jgi:6-phosphogluconolactonase
MSVPVGGGVPRVEVHGSPEELATAVAGAFLRLVTVRQATGDVPQIALTGGTIAEKIHAEIARLAENSEVDWSRIDFFWGDERFAAAGSDDRNATHTRAAFLDRVGADPARVHEVPTTGDVDSVDAAATSYAETLREMGSGSFDLVMLGVGPDGHVASLFPGFPQLDVDDRVAVPVTGSPKPPPERVSLTFPALNRSEQVWFVVSGADKAEAVGRALASQPPDVHEIPAAGVHGELGTTWFLDRDAASQVP